MDASRRILIAGGTGLIGARLTRMLTQRGYEVLLLSRSPKSPNTFRWDVEQGQMDAKALENVATVINLSGANVGQRWTPARKKEILDSRVLSTRLLIEGIKRSGQVKTYITASAIGLYGPADEATTFSETSKPGTDFLATITTAWEAEADRVKDLGVRLVKMRIGIVLSNEGGALEPMVKAVRTLVGSPIGSGRQYMSWVHVDDLCRFVLYAVENRDIAGPYNIVAPNPVTNATFIKTIAKVLHKPLLLPKVPAFVMKLMFGEMSTIILDGAKVASTRLKDTTFVFQFEQLQLALQDLLKDQ